MITKCPTMPCIGYIGQIGSFVTDITYLAATLPPSGSNKPAVWGKAK